MKTQISKYEQQAIDFANKHDVTMTAIYKGHYARFSDHVTAVYSITLARPGKKPFIFDFSTSMNDSFKYRTGPLTYKKGLPPKMDLNKFFANYQTNLSFQGIVETKTSPTLYDILASLTKNDPETFEDFCADYGYDDDSRKALETFNAVDKEWHEVKRMFSDCLDELSEIA